ncbi:MAG: hypothetical protein QXD59_02085 [Candidatus Caldarchaeum sp.]
MGALLVQIDSESVAGTLRMCTGRVQFSSSYATGGDTYTPRQFRMRHVHSLQINPTGGYVFQPQVGPSKVLVFVQSAHTHTENTAAVYTQNATTDASAAAPLSEVANGTNLSTVEANFVAYGV